jgi:hypothetical protein
MGRVFPGASPGARKVVHSHCANDPEFRLRFAREVAAARQGGDFHAAMVVDAGTDPDLQSMVIAYVQPVQDSGPGCWCEGSRVHATRGFSVQTSVRAAGIVTGRASFTSQDRSAERAQLESRCSRHRRRIRPGGRIATPPSGVSL